jgi:hypothetical protein
MSASVRQQPDDRNIELGSAISWPPIVAAASLGLVVLIAVVVFALAAPAAPKKEPAPLQQTAVRTPEPDSFLPAQPQPQAPPREARPQPVVVAATSKPAVPQ